MQKKILQSVENQTSTMKSEGPSLIELTTRLHILQKQLGIAKEEYKVLLETKSPLQDRVMKLYFQKIYSSPTEGKKLLTLPQVNFFSIF